MALSKRIASYDDKTRHGTRSGRSRPWLHKIDVEDFLEALDVVNISRASSDEVLFSCPFPGHSSGDSKPSAYMNTGAKDESKTSAWKCHGCGRSGNAISFYAEHNEISKQEAAAHLKAQYAPDFRAPIGGISEEFERRLAKREQKRPGLEPQPVIGYDTYDDKFGVDWPDAYMEWSQTKDKRLGYLFERGFKPETLMDWNIGFDEISDRFTIPIHDEDGVLIGVKARSWKPKREERIKYRILGDKEGKKARYGWRHYEKARVVFGLNMALPLSGSLWQEDKDVGTVVLVEGELDAIALWQIGIPAVSSGSAHLSEIQARLLRQHFDHVIVFYDSNDAGEHATWGWFDRDDEFHPGVVQDLEPFIRVSVVDDHEDDASGMIQHGKVDELRKLVSTARSSIDLLF